MALVARTTFYDVTRVPHEKSDQAVFFDPLSQLDVLLGRESDPVNGLEDVRWNVRAFLDRQVAGGY